jgi:type IV pilus assembly protein PilM
MAERLVGVVFDEGHLRAAECVHSRGASGVTVLKAGLVELPEGLVDQGEIVDEERFGEALRGLWAETGFTTKRIAMGLDARATTIRRAELPALEREELHGAARYEIAELLSYPVEEAVVSSVELDDPSSSARDLLSLAVRSATVEGFQRAAGAGGLKAARIELTQSALVSMVEAEPTLEPGTLGLVVAVSDQITNVVVYDAGGMMFSRVITAGFDRSGTSLFDQLEMELAALGDFAGSDATVIGGEAPPESVAALSTILEGIERTLSYFTGEVDPTPFSRLVLCGQPSATEALGPALADAHPTATVVRFEHAGWVSEVPGTGSFEQAIAVGHSALVGPIDADRAFDLIPESRKRRRSSHMRLAGGVAAAALLAPLLWGDAMDRRAVARDSAAAAEAAELFVDSIHTALAGLDDERQQAVEAALLQARVDNINADELALTTVLRQLAETLPDDAFLLSIRLERARPGERPTGYVGPPPAAVIRINGVTPDFESVGAWLESTEDVPALAGLWLAQASIASYGEADDAVGAVFSVDGAIVAPPARAATARDVT